MTTSNFGFLILLLTIPFTGATPARANLFVNPSFESPAVPVAPGYLQFFNGSAAIPGWTVVGDNIILVHTTYSEAGPPFFTGMIQFNSQEGLNSLDLTGGGGTNSLSNGIQQTVATIPGLLYEIQFYVGRAQSNNGDSRYQTAVTADLSINGSPRVSFTNSDTVIPGYVGWKQFTTSFTATNSSTTIAFLNGTPAVPPGANCLGLDNVSLTAVLELPGDYNQDDIVNAADYVVWRDRLGSASILPNDDTAGVESGDYARWKNHFGESIENTASLSTLSQSAVPEPSSTILFGVAIPLLLRGVVRKRLFPYSIF